MSAKLKIVISMCLFGTISLFVRNIPLPSSAVALCRAVIALVCLTLWRTVRRGRLRQAASDAPKATPPGRDLPLLFLSGAAMGFNWIFLFEAYRYTTVSVATLSYYFAPVIVMIASPLLFRERMTKKQALCFVGSTIGLVLVVNVRSGGGANHLRGVAFGLAAAALYASVVLMNKGIRRVSGMDRTVLQFVAAALVLAPYVAATTHVSFRGMTAGGWALLLCVGVLHTGVAYVLYFSALSALPGQEAAILSYIDPLVAVLLSLTVLGEPVTALQLAGGGMILAFTLFNEIGGKP